MSRTRFAYLAVASFFVAAIWLAPAAQSRPSAAGSTLVVSFTTAPDTLDPQKSPLNQTWPAWQLSYECLLKATADGKIAPQLATSYKVDAAALNYDFALRPNVRFHNGALMTSADVVYTFDRLKASGIPYAQNRFPTLTSVTAQGPRAVRFTLSKPDPGFLLNMGDPFTVACAILSKKAGESNDLTTQMVGTGPFAMVSYAPTRQLKVKRFDQYWGNKANVANLQIDYTPEASAQLVALLAGKADLIFPDPSIVRPLKGASKTIKIGSVIAATTLRVEFSAAKAPFSNVNVRRAVELAIDRPEAIRGTYLGYGRPAAHIPTGYPWSPALKSYKYIGKHDVAGAKQLLAQAGYPNGFSTSYMYIAGNSPASDRFAQVLKSQLGAVGIDLTLDPVDTPTYLARLGKADYGLAFNQYPYFSDPLLYTSPRPARNGPVPDAVQTLVDKARASTKNADYLQTIRDLSVTEDDQGFPNFVVASPTQFIAYRRNVSNVKLDFSISWLFLTKVIKH